MNQIVQGIVVPPQAMRWDRHIGRPSSSYATLQLLRSMQLTLRPGADVSATRMFMLAPIRKNISRAGEEFTFIAAYMVQVGISAIHEMNVASL